MVLSGEPPPPEQLTMGKVPLVQRGPGCPLLCQGGAPWGTRIGLQGARQWGWGMRLLFYLQAAQSCSNTKVGMGGTGTMMG